MSSDYKLVRIKFNDRENEILNTFKDDIAVLETNDIDFMNFVNLYRALYNLRVSYAGMDTVLSSEEYWPHINYSKDVIEKYLTDKDKNSYKNVEMYILGDFRSALDKQLKDLEDRFKAVTDKLSLSVSMQLWHEKKREMDAVLLDPHPSTNILHNNLIFSLKCWGIKDYYLVRATAILKEKRSVRWLTALGIIATFIIGVFSVLLTIWLQK